MLYPLLRWLLFRLDAETAHNTTLELIESLHGLIPDRRILKPVQVMGLDFPNPVGLAAGLDKNAAYLNGLGKLGFGFIEVGTVTPRPQPGNPLPRMFRIPEYRSIINRMGFNNSGTEQLLANLQTLNNKNFILGINIGKNLTTPVEQALNDYNSAMQDVYPYADYITVNISSPNTPGLRKLQGHDALDMLLSGIEEGRKSCDDRYQCRRPIAVKVAPDLQAEDIQSISDLLQQHHMDALIATNTTLDRSGLNNHPLAAESGGLSGATLKEKSRDILFRFHEQLDDAIPIISAGGIDSAEEATLRMQLGASLIQVYTALIYSGPGLVNKLVTAC